MTGRPTIVADPLNHMLSMITRAARAGQPLTLSQINARLGASKRVVERYVRSLVNQNLVAFDKSCVPWLVKPVPEARA